MGLAGCCGCFAEGRCLEMTAVLLPELEFTAALAALPLVSVDWVLSNPAGAVLTGQRLNAPARGSWFTPGGRVRKGEPLAKALVRVAMDELGVPAASLLGGGWLGRAQLMGAWDHFYSDSAFSQVAATHYVNLPHWLALSWPEAAALAHALPVGGQHSRWRWVAPGSTGVEVHAHVKPYLDWVAAARTSAAKGLPA